MSRTQVLSKGITTDGLVIYYDFINYKCYTSGSEPVRDLTPNNNNILAGPTGSYPSAIYYQDTGFSYFEFYNNGSLSLLSGSIPNSYSPNNSTISFWVKTGVTNDFNQYQYIINYNDGTPYIPFVQSGWLNGFSIGSARPTLFPPSNLYFQIGTTTLNQAVELGIANTSWMDNTWHNITLSISNKTITPYLDAVAYPTVTYTYNAAGGNPLTILNLGGRPSSGGDVFMLYGNLSRFMMYSRPLSSTEVTQNYNAFKDRYRGFP